MNDQNTIESGMDLEGRLRFNADALIQAPSGIEIPGTSYAIAWQKGEESRKTVVLATCAILDDVRAVDAGDELAERIRFECKGMRSAIEGAHVPDSLHLYNWNDKPHRLVYDAANLMVEAADAIADKQSRPS